MGSWYFAHRSCLEIEKLVVGEARLPAAITAVLVAIVFWANSAWFSMGLADVGVGCSFMATH
jgi:hypothetical protein